jgi:NAD(P)H dehydrogenase (quinone)
MDNRRVAGEEGIRVVVTGASGQLGRRTAERVLELRGADGVVLVSRRPEALVDLAARGADVRFGDFDRPESLREAFAGGERMLLVSATDLERRADQQRAAIEAAAAAGVRHVVYTSCLRPEPANPAAVAPSHHATETALRESGLAWTFLRNSLYAEYQAAEASAAAASGRFVHNRGDGRVAYVSRDDCAAAAAAVLVGEGHEGVAYDVTGPEPLGAAELAALYGELGGRAVEAVALDDEGFVASLAGAGADGHLRYGAELVASFGRSIREGYMASCTEIVAALTGRPPLSLREVLAVTSS